jgi:hypothetical protein
MGPSQAARIAFPHKRNNAIFFSQSVRNPPVESWIMVIAEDFGIFCGLDRVLFLTVSKVLLRCWTVFPLTAELQANSCALQVGLAICEDNFLVRKLHGCGETSIVCNLLQ